MGIYYYVVLMSVNDGSNFGNLGSQIKRIFQVVLPVVLLVGLSSSIDLVEFRVSLFVQDGHREHSHWVGVSWEAQDEVDSIIVELSSFWKSTYKNNQGNISKKVIKINLPFHSSWMDWNSFLFGRSPVINNQNNPSGRGSPWLTAFGKNSFNCGIVYPLIMTPEKGSTEEISWKSPFMALIPPMTCSTVQLPKDWCPILFLRSANSACFQGIMLTSFSFNRENDLLLTQLRDFIF